MKWIGQQVYDFVATFRSGIIIDDINITTIQSSSESFADNDTSLMTSAAIDDRINAASASDLTISNFAGSTITTSSESFADNDTTLMTSAAINDRIESFGYGTGDITGVRLTADDSNVATVSSGSADFTVAGGTYIDTSVSGTTLSVAVREAAVTSLTGLTTIGVASATTNIAAGDLTMYNTVNDGNPTISLGSSATERLEIKAEYESGAQGLDIVRFTTFTAGSSSDDGRYAFEVDDTFLLNILDDGLRIKASGNLEIGSGNAILSDSSGTTTLSNIDALDATTESTIESAIDTLSNLTTVGTIGTGVWQGTAIASAYLDADTAHYSATRQVTHHMITDDIDSDVIYISLLDSDAETSTATNKQLPFIAPTAGKLLKIFLRTSVDYSSETFTWKLYTRNVSSGTGGAPSEIGAQSGSGPTNKTMVTYDFTSSLDSGTNAIAAGDKVQISIEAGDGATANGNYFITCMWEWDLS
tara:strand:- start:817 stop:2238 length:1422 start_codon:yes stop_codon:yes gene_type:complete